MEFDAIIKGGDVVIPKRGIQRLDVGIRDGRVVALMADASGETGEVIDATGQYVMPGGIDPHTHLGYMATFEEHAEHDSRAAAIGGITMMHIFAQVNNREEFEHQRDAGNELSMVDFVFSPTFRSADAGEILDEAITEWGVPSFKFFMAYRTAGSIPGQSNDLNDGMMVEIFERLAAYRRGDHGIVACVHAENYEVTDWFTAKGQREGADSLRAWHEASPGFAEAENAMRASYFAELVGCPVYIVHLGAAESVEAIRRAKRTNPLLSAETCPHYLARTVDDDIGNLGKISPPIRTAEDQAEVWKALADGTFDTVGSDNTGTLLSHKEGTIWEAARGIPGVGTIVLSEGVNKGRISLERAVEVTSYNAAKKFNMYPRKGTIEVGSDADLLVVDMNLEKTVTPELLQHYSDYNIYEGMTLKGWPTITMVRGTVVQRDGAIVAPKGHGEYQYLTEWLREPATV